MKFNVQRVLTPAYLTSVTLVVIGVLLGLAWYPVAAWVFVLLGLALNAMAVSVTEIHDAPRAAGAAGRRRPALPSRGVRTRRPVDEPDDGLDTDPDTGAPGRVQHRTVVEPEAETAATPTVPHTGSTASGQRR